MTGDQFIIHKHNKNLRIPLKSRQLLEEGVWEEEKKAEDLKVDFELNEDIKRKSQGA